VADAAFPARIYVGVVNDKALGGVFVSENGGLSWVQKSAGLDGNDVFSLEQASDGTVLAGTGHGIYRLNGEFWTQVSHVNFSVPASEKSTSRRRTTPIVLRAHERGDPFDAAVPAIARADDTLYAATSEGLLMSYTAGESWNLAAGVPRHAWDFVSAARSMVVVATLREAMLSINGGRHWVPVRLPPGMTQIGAVSVDGSGGLWIGGADGVFVSGNSGVSWQPLSAVTVRGVNSLFYDAASQRMLITSGDKNTIAYAVHVPDKTVHYWNSGWDLRLVRPVGDHLVGATLFNGIVVQPRMVDSAELHDH
jgi:hypothetical protein